MTARIPFRTFPPSCNALPKRMRNTFIPMREPDELLDSAPVKLIKEQLTREGLLVESK